MTPVAGRADPARVLVGIPALDEERHIAACIRSLMEPAAEMAAVRLVVADGGSRDRTRAIVAALAEEFPNLALIDNPGRLQSAALNRIVADCARPEDAILVRCDAHSVYPPRYVLDVADSLAGRDAAAVATVMDARGDTCFARAAAWVADTRLGSGGSGHRGGRASGYVDHGHHAGIRLSWFRAVGGYDPAFSHNEDAEFDHRLRQAGGRIWLDARIRIAYTVRPGLGPLARQAWAYGRGRARTVRRHRSRPRLRQLLPPLAVLAIGVGLAVAPLTALGLLPLAGYALLMAVTGVAGAVALRSACGLWAGPALAAMHLPWGAGFLRGLFARRD